MKQNKTKSCKFYEPIDSAAKDDDVMIVLHPYLPVETDGYNAYKRWACACDEFFWRYEKAECLCDESGNLWRVHIEEVGGVLELTDESWVIVYSLLGN